MARLAAFDGVVTVAFAVEPGLISTTPAPRSWPARATGGRHHLRSSHGFHIACSHARILESAARRNAGDAAAMKEKPGGSDER
jgi:hypothetical protein